MSAHSLSSRLWAKQNLPVPTLNETIPFVQKIGDGSLEKPAFLLYEKQDEKFLRVFIGCLGVLLMHAPTGSAEILDLLKGTQEELQEVLKNATSSSEPSSEDALNARVPPFDAYISFIEAVALKDSHVLLEEHRVALSSELFATKKTGRGKAYEDDLGIEENKSTHQQGQKEEDTKEDRALLSESSILLLAALAPCMRLYAEVGKYFQGSKPLSSAYSGWIDIYTSEDFQKNANTVDALLDVWWSDYSSSTSVNIERSQLLEATVQQLYAKAMVYELQIFAYFADFGNVNSQIVDDGVENIAVSRGGSDARKSVPHVLSVAGSDSGGGAGIQADIKTCEAFEVFSSTAITALTAQNTTGVQGVEIVNAEFVEKQMQSVFADYKADLRVVKTGMLPNKEIIEIVAEQLQKQKERLLANDDTEEVYLVVDPVMVASTGFRLIDEAAVDALCDHLIPKATILTPNTQEAMVLLEHVVAKSGGSVVPCEDENDKANKNDPDFVAKRLLGVFTGLPALLLKGGHTDTCGDVIKDVLYLRLPAATQENLPVGSSARGKDDDDSDNRKKLDEEALRIPQKVIENILLECGEKISFRNGVQAAVFPGDLTVFGTWIANFCSEKDGVLRFEISHRRQVFFLFRL